MGKGIATQDAYASIAKVTAPALVREQAFDHLMKAIITGALPPGKRLIERELCEALGVSRTSIREVLRRLEAEKLILVEPRKGPVVARVTKSQAEEIYDIRAHLEGMLISRFVDRASDDDIAAITEIKRRFAEVALRGDVPAAVSVMEEFYDLMSLVASADVLRDVLGHLTARVSHLRATSMSEPGRMIDSVAEIERMVEAVERRDGRSAEEAAVEHVRRAASIALGRLSE